VETRHGRPTVCEKRGYKGLFVALLEFAKLLGNVALVLGHCAR
jgi:hypothetical protein